MCEAKHPFKFQLFVTAIFAVAGMMSPSAYGEKAVEYKKNDSGLYKDVFDQNFYHEGINQLDLGRWVRKILRKKIPAGNVNVFDEIPDSSFFTNRHGKKRMSLSSLQRGYRENENIDLSGPLSVTKGKVDGLHPGFFVEDQKGDAYLLKFDAPDYLELATSAEIIASRFYYALGYQVPQYTIAYFRPDQLQVAPGATMRDDSGFKKDLTKERLEEFMLFVPMTEDGRYRVSASKILSGESKGSFTFRTRRKNDSADLVFHRDRREIRALQVFASWLNNYDVRESNTLDMFDLQTGETGLVHYVIDFNSALGAAAEGPKPPMFMHEHMVDYGETFKSFLSLGFWKKPWQKRWERNGEKDGVSPAVGYFDNIQFDPKKSKTQLPYEAFRSLTRADGFWAAKTMMAFSDEDIRTMVEAGELTDPSDEDYLVKMLVERRDIIARYWFSESTPLDLFRVSGNHLQFEDLSIQYGLEPAASAEYLVEVRSSDGDRLVSMDLLGTSFALDPSWSEVTIKIRKSGGSSKPRPPVTIQLGNRQIISIRHKD